MELRRKLLSVLVAVTLVGGGAFNSASCARKR